MISKLKYFFLILVLLISSKLYASPTEWQIVQNESKISFTGTQNNSPFTGEFKKFSGKITGDINQLKNSYVQISIDINSLSTTFKDIEETLKDKDWFDIVKFPKAIFEASQFKQIDKKTFEANGRLTIRNISLPLIVRFDLLSYEKNKAKIQGHTVLKRTSFGVGKGEWGSTDDVGDEVKVNFTITAIKLQN